MNERGRVISGTSAADAEPRGRPPFLGQLLTGLT